MTVAAHRPTYAVAPGWGKLPDGWSFIEATAVAVDSQDNVYVYNRGAHPVIIFDRHGKFLRSWGEGMTSRAHGITIGPDDTVWLYTADGKLLLSIGDPDRPSPAHSGKPFNRPTHVALSPQTGDLYISDGYGNSRVHKYDPKGRPLFSWGEPGTDPGCFNIPHNIATDAEGLVYVADRENHRVQVFDAKGHYQYQINNLHRACAVYVDRGNGGRIFVGELPTHLPVNAAVPNIGARVSVLTLKGDLLARVGGKFMGEGPGEFIAPHGIVMDSHGDFYVAEVAFTAKGRHENPPREIRSLQKFALARH
jgi:DNA-binding beta-propeller fold protein YncE